MREPYHITTRAEYEYAVAGGFVPLLDCKNFSLEIGLRVQLQREIFGHSILSRGRNIPVANERFYRYMWEYSVHQCEECLQPLKEFSATYISHILTRGANPEMAHDCRNVNILCFRHHELWEHETTRKGMRIYAKNKKRIEELKEDYKQLIVEANGRKENI